ncbi:hypothetical protein B5F12_11050, partial [Pseudoflavonifractor sp. An176]
PSAAPPSAPQTSTSAQDLLSAPASAGQPGAVAAGPTAQPPGRQAEPPNVQRGRPAPPAGQAALGGLLSPIRGALLARGPAHRPPDDHLRRGPAPALSAQPGPHPGVPDLPGQGGQPRPCPTLWPTGPGGREAGGPAAPTAGTDRDVTLHIPPTPCYTKVRRHSAAGLFQQRKRSVWNT